MPVIKQVASNSAEVLQLALPERHGGGESPIWRTRNSTCCVSLSGCLENLKVRMTFGGLRAGKKNRFVFLVTLVHQMSE